MFADMVRLGCYLTYNALVRGNIIDSIQIFGLLAIHGTNSGILMKYYVDFQQDQSMLFVGDETNAKLGFISIVDLLNFTIFACIQFELPIFNLSIVYYVSWFIRHFHLMYINIIVALALSLFCVLTTQKFTLYSIY